MTSRAPAPAAASSAMARMPMLAAALCMALLGACASPPAVESPADTGRSEPPSISGRILGRNDRLLVYQPREDEPVGDLAHRFLGSPGLAWMISDLNKGITRAEAGKPIVVPLVPLNKTGVRADRMQTVPILCYHRFAPGAGGRGNIGKMTVGAADFAAQLDWLARNHYHVLRLQDLESWLDGKKALPARSVVITVDDGYGSFYRHAYPLLKKHGFPATLFVYTDFIGAADAVDWKEMKEMVDAGLVDVQAHSRTHRNLLDRYGETDERYHQVLENETRAPRDLLARRLGIKQRHYAYPYGDANQAVLDALTRQGVELGLTVTPGGNPFFAQPLMLRRTMIYGDMDLDDFKARLQISRGVKTK